MRLDLKSRHIFNFNYQENLIEEERVPEGREEREVEFRRANWKRKKNKAREENHITATVLEWLHQFLTLPITILLLLFRGLP